MSEGIYLLNFSSKDKGINLVTQIQPINPVSKKKEANDKMRHINNTHEQCESLFANVLIVCWTCTIHGT